MVFDMVSKKGHPGCECVLCVCFVCVKCVCLLCVCMYVCMYVFVCVWLVCKPVCVYVLFPIVENHGIFMRPAIKTNAIIF